MRQVSVMVILLANTLYRKDVANMEQVESDVQLIPGTLPGEEQSITIRRLDRIETTSPCGASE
jgi:hypothetical protein